MKPQKEERAVMGQRFTSHKRITSVSGEKKQHYSIICALHCVKTK